jgi:hypothetical protein
MKLINKLHYVLYNGVLYINDKKHAEYMQHWMFLTDNFEQKRLDTYTVF